MVGGCVFMFCLNALVLLEHVETREASVLDLNIPAVFGQKPYAEIGGTKFYIISNGGLLVEIPNLVKV